MRITHLDPHDERRRAEYPDIGDQLDAIWKALALNPDLPPDTADMLKRVQQVKDKYPKPAPEAG